jgi:hypothetical protein
MRIIDEIDHREDPCLGSQGMRSALNRRATK